MLDFLMTSTLSDATITLTDAVSVIGSSIILGIIISLIYMKLHKKEGYEPSFALTLVMLSTIISIVILLVGNNAARAFSLAGAFSIIRFRNVLGSPEDMSYIFFALAIGLACGTGYIPYAVIFTVIICTLLIVLKLTKFTDRKNKNVNLKIMIPENINYVGLFDDTLGSYTDSFFLKRVKSLDFGSTFELFYKINLKNEVNEKEFLDAIREKNGNLNVTITASEMDS